MTWREFLVEHAKFPFPLPAEDGSYSITDMPDSEVGLLERDWKAQYAMRDETMIQKLCLALENILGDTLLRRSAPIEVWTSFAFSFLWHTRVGG